MKRTVVELKGNLTFCGINKGFVEFGDKKGLLLETDVKSGFCVWCPETMIDTTFEVKVDE
jgi:hypothetical protein